MMAQTPAGPSPADGLGEFLRLLASYPSPDDTLRALIEGPLRDLGAWAGLMWIERAGSLEAVAGHRTDGVYHELYGRIPVMADMPVPLCFRESEVIVTEVSSMGVEYSPLAEHASAWDGFRPDGHTRSLLQIPMVNRGVSLGVVGIACAHRVSLDTLHISFLDGIGAALGLWVTHPATRLPDGALAPSDDDTWIAPVALTPRQQQIVRLIDDGRSNAAIAVQLACSVSTVKQEIQRIQRAVRAADRGSAAARAIELGLIPLTS